ncbi:MAG: hypothetical protein Q8N23_28010 [Archangium sp.]|nr:hypothetical protein [Archangium sp.]MDP3156549.1 hypothetical protein [Archangium sp.]
MLCWAICAASCADLQVTTPLQPLAIGETFEARFQFATSLACTVDKACRAQGLPFIESISSVEIDDASLFEVNVPLMGDTFSVKALREGQTLITVNGIDDKGARHTAAAPFRCVRGAAP